MPAAMTLRKAQRSRHFQEHQKGDWKFHKDRKPKGQREAASRSGTGERAIDPFVESSGRLVDLQMERLMTIV
jgi:hypothetical protein